MAAPAYASPWDELEASAMKTAVLDGFLAPGRQEAEAHAGVAANRSAEAAVVERAPAVASALPPLVRCDVDERPATVAVLRAALVLGAVAATAVAWLFTSGTAPTAEPELVALLRGMAVIKALLAASAAVLVWWRLAQPISSRVSFAYIVCASVLFASCVLIWQLASIVAAALLFHAAGLIGLIVAMREDQRPRLGRPRPRRSMARAWLLPLRSRSENTCRS